MNKEYESSQYDEIYASGGAEKIYELPYWHTGYYPLFKEVLRTLKRRGARSILEVGCGTGGFAHIVLDRAHEIAYRGFDFSPVAVDRAKARTGIPERFYVGDARSSENYDQSVDAIVCTEVLEHIDSDLEVVSQWPSGTFCVCSVPNFDADNHVRFFKSAEEVHHRYGDLIKIDSIVKINKPVLSDISFRSYARAVRWNRYRPKRVLEILGFVSFDNSGGWFVFSGTRK